MSKYLKIAIPVLFVLATLLGFIERKNLADFSFGSTKTTLKHTGSSADSLEGYYETSQQLRGTANEKNTATFLAVGDIILSRNVAQKIQDSGNANLPFQNMADILHSTDFNFANLESPVAPNKQSIVAGGHSLIFGASGDYVPALKDFHFKIVNLANNHAFDQGLSGLEYTRATLDTNGIQHVGTGDNLDAAWQPAVVEANGIKICFVGASYASVNDSGKTTNPYVARMEDLDHLKNAINNAKLVCDFTVATMHGGVEYTATPNQLQTTFAHTAIDDGADMVIGAHPHRVQTIEKYCPLQSSPPQIGGVDAQQTGRHDSHSTFCPNAKYIFYSLGNFIFDQEWSEKTKEGLTLKITVTKNPSSSLQGPRTSATLTSIELMPVIIENYSTPRPATAGESQKILNGIGQTETILK